MPAFESRLSETELNAVIAYVNEIAGSRSGPGEAPPKTANVPAPVLPAEAAKGKELFFDAAREARCAVCHQAEGRGGKAGPVLPLSGNPPQVRRAVLQSGRSFPAVLIDADVSGIFDPSSNRRPAGVFRLFDLGALPPVQRTLRGDEIRSLEPDPTWKHTDVTKAYSETELGEIQNYLHWIASVSGKSPGKYWGR
jgi:mono/diheme cytochrome c family protein